MIQTATAVQADHGGRGEQPSPSEACFSGAGAGDGRAWELLVRRYRPYLLRLAASYRIGQEAEDAVQLTFLKLLEHGATIRKPEAVKYWLAITLRRECLDVVNRRRREQPCSMDQLDVLAPPASDADVDSALLRDADIRLVRQALTHLPARQRELLELLSDADCAGYRAVSEHLDIPVGSIGPTRQRALARLEETLGGLSYERSA